MNKIGMDIGATSTRIAILNEQNDILDIKSFTTDVNDFDKEFVEIKKIIKQMIKSFGEIKSIGMAAPGPLDIKHGKIINPPNLPGWHNLAIVKEFEKAFPNVKVSLDNDANIAGLGQYISQSIKPESLFYITVSSGVGAGLILNGKIHHGYNGVATELANSLPSLDDGKDPSKTGIEYFTSGNNIKRVLNDRGVKVANAKEAFDLIGKDKVVDEYFKEYKKRMAAFISTIIYFLDPEVIVLGGSVSLNNKKFFDEIINYVFEITKDVNHKTKIVFASDLTDTTLKGAANL